MMFHVKHETTKSSKGFRETFHKNPIKSVKHALILDFSIKRYTRYWGKNNDRYKFINPVK